MRIWGRPPDTHSSRLALDVYCRSRFARDARVFRRVGILIFFQRLWRLRDQKWAMPVPRISASASAFICATIRRSPDAASVTTAVISPRASNLGSSTAPFSRTSVICPLYRERTHDLQNFRTSGTRGQPIPSLHEEGRSPASPPHRVWTIPYVQGSDPPGPMAHIRWRTGTARHGRREPRPRDKPALRPD